MKNLGAARLNPGLSLPSPWVLFLLFGFSSALAAYGTFSFLVKFAVLTVGLVLPFALEAARLLSKPAEKTAGLGPDLFGKIPAAVWLAIAALGLFLRLYQLTGLSLWPLHDEGLLASGSMDLSEKWDWRIFYSVNDLLPLNFWAEGLYFKFLAPSLFSLWLYPALLSLAVLAAGYGTCRLIFPRSYALPLFSLLSLSFWPIYAARFAVDFSLFPLWEVLTLLGIGLLLKKKIPPAPGSGLLLGLWVGLGFYTSLPWALVAALAALVLAVKLPRLTVPFVLTAGLTAAPLGLAFLKGSHPYLAALWTGDVFSWKEHLRLCLDYVTNLFWTNQGHLVSFGPFWGGFLNPLLSSCFFLGCLELLRNRQNPWVKFLALALPLCFLPAFLTNNINMYRVLQVLPFVLAVTALGLQGLLRVCAGRKIWTAFGVFLLLSTALDAYHLFGRYGGAWKETHQWQYKGLEGYRAYQALEPWADQKGPGYILTELGPMAGDSAFRLACYPFDAQRNPRLEDRPAQWAAVLTDPGLEPFLKKIFPGVEWRWLSEGLDRPAGGTLLGVIPLTPSTRAILERWREADRCFRTMNFQDGIQENPAPPEEQSRASAEIQGLIQRDRFLNSCFGQKMVLRYSGSDPSILIPILHYEGIHGYPTAFFYFEMGNLLLRQGKTREAKAAYGKAVHSEGNHTGAEEALVRLE